MSDTTAPRGDCQDQGSWLENRMPLREEYLCMKGLEYFIEWVEAGMPRKDS